MSLERSVDRNSEVVKKISTQVATLDESQLSVGISEALDRTYQIFERNVTFVGKTGNSETMASITDKQERLKDFFELNTDYIRSFLVQKVTAKIPGQSTEAQKIIDFLLSGGSPPNMAHILLGQTEQIDFGTGNPVDATVTRAETNIIDEQSVETKSEPIKKSESISSNDDETFKRNTAVLDTFFDSKSDTSIKVTGWLKGKTNKEKFRSEMRATLKNYTENLGITLTNDLMGQLQKKLIDKGAIKKNGSWPTRRTQKINIALYSSLIELSNNNELKTEKSVLDTFFVEEKFTMMHRYGKQFLPILIHITALKSNITIDQNFLETLKANLVATEIIKQNGTWRYPGEGTNAFVAAVKAFCEKINRNLKKNKNMIAVQLEKKQISNNVKQKVPSKPAKTQIRTDPVSLNPKPRSQAIPVQVQQYTTTKKTKINSGTSDKAAPVDIKKIIGGSDKSTETMLNTYSLKPEKSVLERNATPDIKYYLWAKTCSSCKEKMKEMSNWSTPTLKNYRFVEVDFTYKNSTPDVFNFFKEKTGRSLTTLPQTIDFSHNKPLIQNTLNKNTTQVEKKVQQSSSEFKEIPKENTVSITVDPQNIVSVNTTYAEFKDPKGKYGTDDYIFVTGPLIHGESSRYTIYTGGLIENNSKLHSFIKPEFKPNSKIPASNFDDNNGIVAIDAGGKPTLFTYNEYEGLNDTAKGKLEASKFAFQNGPILYDAANTNKPNPHTKSNPKKTGPRVGMGWDEHGKVIFVYTKESTNLYEFGQKMKEANCVKAIYLDGAAQDAVGYVFGDKKNYNENNRERPIHNSRRGFVIKK